MRLFSNPYILFYLAGIVAEPAFVVPHEFWWLASLFCLFGLEMIRLRARSVGVWLVHYRDILFFVRLGLIFISTVVTEIVRLCFPIWNWDSIPLVHRTKFFFVFLSYRTDALLSGSFAIIFFILFRTWWWTWGKWWHRLFYFLLDLGCLIFQ